MSGIIKVIIPMIIWGSLGIFVKNISLDSFELAFLRGLIASIFLGSILIYKNKIKKSKCNRDEDELDKLNKYSKRGLLILILSGAAIGFNWVFLFKSYNYTTVSNATLGYYFAPAIIILLSPVFLKEKFTIKRFLSVIAAILGLFLIIGTQQQVSDPNFNHVKGISIALIAACFYASVVILNKYTEDFDDYQRTFIQLLTATIVLLPFVIYRKLLVIDDLKTLILIITLGMVHTGIAYSLYFSAMKELKAQTTAILGYIDPVSAIFFSVTFLKEPLSIYQIIGGVIILASAFIAERPNKKEIIQASEV